MCETVLHNTDVPRSIREEGKKLWFGQLDDSEDEYDDDGRVHTRSMGNSNDDFGTRRRRLNTVVRLEKMRKEQQAAAMISTVRWKDPGENVENSNNFEKRNVVPKRPLSALTKLIAEHASEPDSPFVEYAKFDGQSQLGVPSRTIRIFINLQNQEDRNYPMIACVIASAKVSELIGLICYKYNQEKKLPPISGSVSNFALYIAEDDGSADADFPSLEAKEIVSKFGFTSLALVRTSGGNSATEASTSGDNEVKKTSSSEQPPAVVLESTDYHSFKGYLLHKVRPKTEISLGISWDQVEIKPCWTQRSTVTTMLWPKPNLKATQLAMEVIVDCVPMASVANSVAIIYYHTEKRKWRRLRIECHPKTVDQVTAKLTFILEIRGSHYRQEYLHHSSSHKPH
uniref:EOG090X072S n=1 Tax=Evadne anonyx TaxID=141404 RepID=A0A9N6WXQ1_9CRUS|nr:EOG090X072S [Evadne anonyx]